MNDLRLTNWVQDKYHEEFRLHRTIVSNGSEVASIGKCKALDTNNVLYICYLYGHTKRSGTIWDNWEVFSSEDIDVLKLKINIKLKEYGYIFDFI